MKKSDLIIDEDKIQRRNLSSLFFAIITVLLLTIPVIAFWYHAAAIKYFNPDELEHAHAVFLLSLGQIPYRDFFEHHPPLIYHIFQLFFNIHGRSVATLFLFRKIMASCMVVCATALFFLGWKINRNIWGGVIACVAWSFLVIVALKGIEFRPDPPALTFAAIGLAAYIAFGDFRSFLAITIGALCWGIAGAFTQKAIFPFLGLSAYHFIGCVSNTEDSITKRFLKIVLWVGMAGIPIGLCCVYYALLSPTPPPPPPSYSPEWVASLPGALPYMIDRVIFWNLNWVNRFSPLILFQKTLIQNFGFWVMACLGTLFAVVLSVKKKEITPILAVALTAISSAIGLLLIPVPYLQYFLWVAIPCPVMVSYTVFYMLKSKGEAPVTRKGNIVFTSTVAFLTVILILFPSMHRKEAIEKKFTHQTEKINFFIKKVPADWKIMDGWTGFGVFNRSAWYYFFLHHEIMQMLPKKVQLQGALLALKEAQIIIRDKDIKSLPLKVQQKIDTSFIQNGVLWIKK